MTIFRSEWFLELNNLTTRIARAHSNLTVIAAMLRDTSAGVWSIVPNGAPSPSGGVEGWRDHYTAERQQMVNFLAANRARATTESAIVVAGMDGYIASIAALAGPFSIARANYLDGNGNIIITELLQADRNILATAIEAELEV